MSDGRHSFVIRGMYNDRFQPNPYDSQGQPAFQLHSR